MLASGVSSISCLALENTDGKWEKTNTQSKEEHLKRKNSKWSKLVHLIDSSKSQLKLLTRKPYAARVCTMSTIMFCMTSTYYSLMTWFPELFQRFAEFEKLYVSEPASVCTVTKLKQLNSNISAVDVRKMDALFFPSMI